MSGLIWELTSHGLRMPGLIIDVVCGMPGLMIIVVCGMPGLMIDVVCGMQAPGLCCSTSTEAARSGHYGCFNFRYCSGTWISHRTLHPALLALLRSGREDFFRRLFSEKPLAANDFASVCIMYEDVASLRFALDTVPTLNLDHLAFTAIDSVKCLRLLLDRGAHLPPPLLSHACKGNRLTSWRFSYSTTSGGVEG
jgi:hypothetical protein